MTDSAYVSASYSPYAAAMAIEADPAVPVGCACSECGRPYGLSHLGTCSGSMMMSGGCGIVGFRIVAKDAAHG